MTNRVFVFGSNEAGIHGAGAAQTAYKKHGARWGKSYGHYGDSFAIPTKDAQIKKTLPLAHISAYVGGFLVYARSHPELTFQVTRIGCGLAGLLDEEVAPLFLNAPQNCQFDNLWEPILRGALPMKTYWGSF